MPLTHVQVKSQIARPSLGERVSRGTPYRVFGAAWAGESDIAMVEMSDDGGQHWQEARLLGESVP
ncbi:MAG: hypothetical protein C0485_05570 [Pirellula sp.]|nr:hypothetical protein [Pirellula sp.]